MNQLAKANAQKVLRDFCIDSPDKLNFEGIAGYENIFIEERDLEGKEGQIVFKGGMGIISIDNKVEAEQKRFTIAHEFGHFYNEQKKDLFYRCSAEDIRSIYTVKWKEVHANDFAAEFLMPTDWFKILHSGKSLVKNF